jgi:polyvinyl alcohol dehydrogenase (cytochrome)
MEMTIRRCFVRAIFGGLLAATVLSSPASAPRNSGKEVYSNACESCHGPGANGAGQGPALQPFDRDLQALTAIVRQGINLIPAIPRSVIGDAEIPALYAYLKTLAARSAPPASPTANQTQDLSHPQGTNAGIFAFTGRCASCHDTGRNGATDRYALNRHTPEEVLESITTGSMAQYARDLTEYEKRVAAVYVGGRPLGAAAAGDASQMRNRCDSRPPLDFERKSSWNGWGFDDDNSRFQSSPGLSAADVPKLRLKWAFGFPMGNSAYGQPSIVGGRVFVGADTGFVYALDAATGCIYSSFRANAGVRTAITVGPGTRANRFLAYFGDIKGNVYAVNAETGAKVWTDRVDSHPVARVTGTPKLVAGRLYVPLSSLEESGAGNPNYPCCTFRGGVVSYDAVTGTRIWKSYTIAREPIPVKTTSKGTQLWGPAGAGVWSSPTVDLKRRAVYVATGNGYTQPAAEGSDAVVAFDLDTGKRLWTKQVMANDAYVRDCPGKYRPNVPTENKSETCPDDLGPDMDFGNAPILRTLPGGRTLIVIGQKDGHAWGLDPDRGGEVVWSRQVGLGIDNGGGGMMWGSAADDRLGYFPVTRRDPSLGLAALRLDTGEIAWRATPPDGGGAPVTVIPGVVFFGAGSGTIYAYSTADGKAIWHLDTARDFDTVNGVAANGGNINGAGPVIADGMLFVPSGYSDLGGGVRGNVLLAFAVR